ncbi:hypothetical protein NUW54_g9690 [Trametes sanguinea]|uniref:Uncharacterized protein n=1 Tax=Trametes sanguinea TaxID=158606 RepID=A0ACC1P460_9APHY|nr:hypothetical protein NUW54_g9690 [Trametes sanguinea]
MATDTAKWTATITPAGSAASLDIQDVLSSFSGECLLAASISLVISDSGSSHSFDDAPPFPTSAKPLIFTAELGVSLHGSHTTNFGTASRDSRLLTTVPTGPRIKMMMLEPASVECWLRSIRPSTEAPCPPPIESPDNEDTVPTEWVAEGSLFSPRAFAALLGRRLSSAGEDASLPYGDETEYSADLTLVNISASVSSASATLSQDGGADEVSREAYAPAPLPMPTIMVSNSTAALPLSLESSQSLHREVPLAVRRGKKPPPALSLGSMTTSGPSDSCDSYPDIPTPFLGSPTTCIPTIEVSQAPVSRNMDLSTMCADLRSRLPAPPFTPTELTSSRCAAFPEVDDGLSSPQSSEASDLDDEEWAFARDLVVDWHVSRGFQMQLSPPLSPAGDLPYASEPESPTVDSPFPGDEPFAIITGDTSSEDEDDVAVQTPVDVKLTRRKTVIIQTPEPGLAVNTSKLVTAEKDADVLIHDVHDPVPFELPSASAISGAVLDFDRDCQETAPTPSSRPASTASLRPIRGILKGKKSVRFSAVDLLHEYSPSSTPPARHSIDGAGVAPRGEELMLLQPDPVARVRRITAEVHKSSPLRESHTPTPHPVRTTDKRIRSHGPAPSTPQCARWPAGHSPHLRGHPPLRISLAQA